MNYLFKSNKLKLFELLLVASSIIISVVIIQNNTNLRPKASEKTESSINFYAGWNFFAFSFASKETAKSMCLNHPQIESIARFESQNWIYYNCIEPEVSNFPIAANAGYFVKVLTDPFTITTNSKIVKPKFSLEEGWNPVALTPSFTGYINAEDVCLKSPDTEYKILEVDRWYNGGWNAHVCGLPFNNFEIKDNTGYFLKAVGVNSESTLKIKSPAVPK